MTQLIAQAFAVEFGSDDAHATPLQRQIHVAIKHADMVALATEKRDLMPHSVEPWSYLHGIQPLPQAIHPLPPHEAKQAFLDAWAVAEARRQVGSDD